MSDPALSRPGRRAMVSGAVVGLVLVGLVGGWALRTMLAPAPDVLAGQDYTLVAADHGTVGRSLRLNTTAQWSTELVVPNRQAGTITSVELDSGAMVDAGESLYTVDLRPVGIAEGTVPAFRDLRHGDEGPDVAQLQEFLRTVGYHPGPVDGEYGDAVRRAVQDWQRDLGVEPDGRVRHGDLVFVPKLPARLALVSNLVVGATVTGGEEAVRVLSDSPSFTIALPENQALIVSPGMLVEIPRDDGRAWRAEISEIRPPNEQAAPIAVLAGVDGAPICGEECGEISFRSEDLLPSVIHVVPEQSGVTVPAAAVVTTAAGDTVVVLGSGELRPVEVVASASGTAVVNGVEAGEQVRTPGEIPVVEDQDSR